MKDNVPRDAISAKGVSKNYRLGKFDVAALTDVSLRVAHGEFMAIAGSSGSGKTTLLNLLGCLDRPTLGDVFVGGVPAASLSNTSLAHLRAVKIGFIFQNFNLVPTLSALENVEYPLLILGTPGRTRRARAKEMLERVGLGHHLAHRPDALSGGQRQRVAIARAMVKNPQIVLADEPTASLDRTTAEEVMRLMKELNEERGTTFVLSSHDPLVLAKASRVFYLEDGKVKVQSTHGELRHVA